MRRMKQEFKKRMSETATGKGKTRATTATDADFYDDDDDTDKDDEKEQQMRLVVQIAVRAGLLAVAGLSLCFSTLFIPGVIPFLGGLLCGVSLVEPPPLPGDLERIIANNKRAASRDGDGGTTSPKKYREHDLKSRSGGDNGVLKQMLMNMIHHFF